LRGAQIGQVFACVSGTRKAKQQENEKVVESKPHNAQQ
jgi:hypothetical protein